MYLHMNEPNVNERVKRGKWMSKVSFVNWIARVQLRFIGRSFVVFYVLFVRKYNTIETQRKSEYQWAMEIYVIVNVRGS